MEAIVVNTSADDSDGGNVVLGHLLGRDLSGLRLFF